MARDEMQKSIESDRFLLQPLGRWAAFRLTYSWTQDSAFMSSYCGSGEARTRWKWYREMIRPNKRTKFAYAIVPHGQITPIGAHFLVLRGYRSCMLTVGIHDRNWWGKDVVQEVRSRLIDHIFDHTDIDRLYGQVMARNFASIFNYQKLGFKHVGTLHRCRMDKATGALQDELIFEMFREQWAAGKSHG